MTAGLVILAAGGTGGHVMPAAALAGALTEAGQSVRWYTDPRGVRFADAFAPLSPDVLAISSHMHGGIFGKLRSLAGLLWAALVCARRFLADRPALVVGFGGYPALPPLLAARMLSVPTVLHEQNAVLGKVNRWIGRSAKLIAHGMPTLAGVTPDANTHYVGNPVRTEVLAARKAYVPPAPGGRISLLVIGGSQGARVLSDLVPAVLASLGPDLKARLAVTHQARAEDQDRVRQIYADAGITADVQPFFSDVGPRIAAAHLVIARAGASTLAEISAHGRPAILFPLPIAVHDHQRANADPFVEAGAACVVDERRGDARDQLSGHLAALLDANTDRLVAAAAAMEKLGIADASTRMIRAIAPFLGETDVANAL